MKRRNGNIWYYFGSTKSFRGVGFYVKKRIASHIVKIEGVTERIVVLKIKLNEKTRVTVIQVYALR